jgi:LPXTG-motif cell wall-anchored protein
MMQQALQNMAPIKFLRRIAFPRRSSGSVLMIAGILIAFIGLFLLAEPYYTYAVERTRVNLWLKQEVVEANPLPGQPGSLYEQLILEVECRGRTLYNGSMSGLVGPFNLSVLTGPVYTGETLSINFHVHLPGPETGNEYQGSRLVTKFTLISELLDPDRKVVSYKISISPREALFNLQNLNPGDSYSGVLKVTLTTDLPRTTGAVSTIGITLLGFLMILGGLLLKRKFKRNYST